MKACAGGSEKTSVTLIRMKQTCVHEPMFKYINSDKYTTLTIIPIRTRVLFVWLEEVFNDVDIRFNLNMFR